MKIMKSQILRKGVVLVDKPRGMTSFDVVERVCEILGVKKAGHAGTLDPNVTGLMLIALEEARKAMPVLMGMDKEYVGKMLLHGDVERERVGKSFRKFTGEIVQKPPVRSRVARVERKRKVYSLEILNIEGRGIKFRTSCEAGTYIRKLIYDIGQDLGCGAHMSGLMRTKIGPFQVTESVKLEKLDESRVIKLEKILERIGTKKITVKDHAIQKIRNGSPVLDEWILKADKAEENEIVGIFDPEDNIIAIGKPSGSRIKTDRVFIS